MATRQTVRGFERGDGQFDGPPLVQSEPPLGDLFRQLTDDMSHLVRQEVNLAKVEMRQVGAGLGRDAAKIGIALGLAIVGALAMGAFLIVGIGAWIDNYWLSSLLVGLAFLAIGAVLANSAVNHIKHLGVKPETTIQTLREDAEWAKREARELKRDLGR